MKIQTYRYAEYCPLIVLNVKFLKTIFTMCFIWRSYSLVLLGNPLRVVIVYSHFTCEAAEIKKIKPTNTKLLDCWHGWKLREKIIAPLRRNLKLGLGGQDSVASFLFVLLKYFS